MLLDIIILTFINVVFTYGTTINYNKCNGIEALLKNNYDCLYNPDEYLNVPQMIARHGYPSETHIITTDDGYLLEIHRIPGSKSGKRGGQPVYLQHGLLGSSADWLMNGNNSLGFLLADQGYDVWLGNARGNTYSKAHISIPKENSKFWNFSWHEMGMHDLPATLYHISNITEKPREIIYIGHSMGTTMFFVLSSLNHEVSKNVKLMIALAPVGYMTHIKSPIKYLAPFSSDFQWLAKYLGLNQFLPNNKILKFLAYDCELFEIDKNICENFIFALCGFDKAQFNQKMLPLILKNDPAGTSTKTIIHYAQEIKNGGNFQQYDYGINGNLIAYGTATPPKYKVNNMKTPVYMMYGENDWLASYVDVQQLATNISSLVGLYKVKLESFNHVDFLFGKDAEQLVYRPLMNVMLNYTKY
ncbi:lipase 3 [Anoplophora glabripennis]|nr:lipase 3 [Anoplophora glabripennis]